MRRWTRNARASTLNPLADCIADRWIDYEQSVISLSILEFDDLMDHFNSQFTSGLLRLEWILTVIQEITYILLSKTRFMASQADRQSVKCAVGKLGFKTHNMHILSTYVAVVFKLKLIGLIAVIFSTAHYGCHFFTFFHLFHNRIVVAL